MGSITRSFANNITTSGVLLPASLTNNSIANVTAYNASVATGGMVLISSQTASDSASISFTTGLDSTYKEYQFYFIDIHPRTDTGYFSFNLSTDAGSNYNTTKTTTFFQAFHEESEPTDIYGITGGGITYDSGEDLAQSTSFQRISYALGNGADESASGLLQLFNPSSTTYVKHFISSINMYWYGNASFNTYVAGYGNTTSAVNAVQFKMSSGNMDGTILLYGIV
jgi:hypothetical protein